MTDRASGWGRPSCDGWVRSGLRCLLFAATARRLWAEVHGPVLLGECAAPADCPAGYMELVRQVLSDVTGEIAASGCEESGLMDVREVG